MFCFQREANIKGTSSTCQIIMCMYTTVSAMTPLLVCFSFFSLYDQEASFDAVLLSAHSFTS